MKRFDLPHVLSCMILHFIQYGANKTQKTYHKKKILYRIKNLDKYIPKIYITSVESAKC